jgi:hypothetical protein
MSFRDGVSVDRAGDGASRGAVSSVAPPGFQSAPAPMPPPPTGATAHLPRRDLALFVGILLAAAVAAVLVITTGGTSRDLAIAQAINLRASDLPGFSPEPSQPNPASNELQARARHCPGIQGLGQHSDEVKAESSQFQAGPSQVGSEAAIERSSGIVASDFALLRTGRIQSCLRQMFEGLSVPASNGILITVSGVQLTSLTPPATGAHQSFGLRMAMTFSALGRSVPFTMDILGFGVGRDEVSLSTFSVEQPFPARTEQQLSKLLVARALAHPH